ncbi:TetR/AcrR family transcriptional regulator [Streptomyces sp. NPDC058690]|uniref:TetR/AcrR family transcriptional regulator n=1 Tax=Streptomyces sp. NPDC058690 TaxID=3346600 RepID=UPI00364F6A5D
MSRREEILVEAIRLFDERGFQSVSTDDMGEAAGASGPSIGPTRRAAVASAGRAAGSPVSGCHHASPTSTVRPAWVCTRTARPDRRPRSP